MQGKSGRKGGLGARSLKGLGYQSLGLPLLALVNTQVVVAALVKLELGLGGVNACVRPN